MKKRNCLAIGVFFALILNQLSLTTGYAQQDAQFTQYMYNGLYYNPAFAGKETGYQFSALHRTQWLGYSTSAGTGGAINTQLLTAAGRIAGTNIGIGLNFVNDDIGPTINQEVNYPLPTTLI